MKDDKKNPLEERKDNAIQDANTNQKQSPFKNAGQTDTSDNSSEQEAIAEQQRKEALTERD